MIGWFGIDYKPWAMMWSVPQVLFFSEKMTSLDLLDMHFVNLNDLNQYLVQIGLHLSQISETCIWGF